MTKKQTTPPELGVSERDVARPAAKIDAPMLEKVLLQGDLSRLTPAERMSYYNSVCQSLGLNPLTRPFDYLALNGKLILYAKREASEQLRRIHHVSLTIKSHGVIEGCYVVHTQATLPDGRQDEATGAVSLDGLRGESRANALMRAETKSKRRATLSICGLSFLDESELDSVRGADADPAPAVTEAQAKPWTTYRQMLDCFAELRLRVGDEVYYQTLHAAGIQHSNQLKSPEKALALYHQMRSLAEEGEEEAQPKPKRMTARERILQQPSYVEEPETEPAAATPSTGADAPPFDLASE